MIRKPVLLWCVAGAFLLVIYAPCHAGLIVTTHSVGGNLFEYDFTLVNNSFANPQTHMAEPISGFNLFHANTIFGLDSSSFILAPQHVGGNTSANWDFFAPLPMVADELNFFSLTPTADIAINGMLSGFAFRSTTDPSSINLGGLAYDVIGGTSGQQLVTVPEPSSFTQSTVMGLIASVFFAMNGRWKWRYSRSSLIKEAQ